MNYNWCIKYYSVMLMVFLLFQALDRYSCGSSCWNSSPTNLVKRSSRGPATVGNLSWLIPMRSPADGECGRTNLRWTMKNSLEDYVIITIKISSTRRLANDMSIGSCATCRRCLGKCRYISLLNISYFRQYEWKYWWP